MAGASDTQSGTSERYRILGSLGAGGMGEVLRGVHVELGREVAIKRLKSELSVDQSVLKRFENEARAVNLIRHENIVEVTDFYADSSGQVHMVMELLEGRSLGDLIRASAPLPVARVAHIGSQIADALGAAHRHGVIHRDLKPENVFLIRRKASDDYVKLLDFGIARLRPECGGLEATESGLIIGTPVYMSPEQAKGTTADKATDMYSLGVLLYEMLTGHWPFPRSSAVQMMMSHIADEPAPLDVPNVPEELTELVHRCLAKEPEARPQDMKEVSELLERWATPTRLSRSEAMVAARALSDTYFPPSEISTEETWKHNANSPRALSEEEQTTSALPSPRVFAALAAIAILAAVLGWWLIKTRTPPNSKGTAVSGEVKASGGDSSRASLHERIAALGMPLAPEECQSSKAEVIEALESVTKLLDGGGPGGARAEDKAAVRELESVTSDMSPELYLWLARAYLQAGDTDAAIRNARLSYGSCKGMAAAYATEGTALAFAGDDAAAIEKLQTALSLSPAYVDARFNLALSQLGTQQLTQALGNLSMVIEQEPELPGARFLRGQCALQLGDAKSAVVDLRLAVQEQEDSANAWYALGFALSELEKNSESAEAYCRARALGDTRAPCDDVTPEEKATRPGWETDD